MDQLLTALGIGHPHPVTNEYVLSFQEVLEVLQHIRSSKGAVVLGGDVLDTDDQYTYANWYFTCIDSLSRNENAVRSCDEVMRYISNLSEPNRYHYILVLN